MKKINNNRIWPINLHPIKWAASEKMEFETSIYFYTRPILKPQTDFHTSYKLKYVLVFSIKLVYDLGLQHQIIIIKLMLLLLGIIKHVRQI